MSLLAKKRLRIEKGVVTRIIRSIGGKGTLNIKVGQEVTPSDIIGSFEMSSGFRILNLANILSINPQDVKKYLKRQIGQKIYKGELLAFKKKGLIEDEKIVTAPTDGIVDFINPLSGELRITFLPRKQELPAALFGVVEQIDENREQVVIRTEVSRVYGLFGTSKIREGILHFLGKRDDLISASKISSKYSDSILVGGSMLYKDAVSEAISSEVRGIITGGIAAKDYKTMAGGRIIFPKTLENDIGISIIICEGFGSQAMGEDIYNFLSDYDGKFVIIDGNKAIVNLPSYSSSSMSLVRTTHLPPISDIRYSQNESVVDIKLGQRVRVIGTSFLGEQGKIYAIDKSKTTLPSGIQTFLLTIETKRRKIQIPSNNVEVIE